MDSGFWALGFIGLRVRCTTGLAYASGQGTAGSTKATVMMVSGDLGIVTGHMRLRN